MEGSPVPPACELCGTQTMTIKHLLTQCTNLEHTRNVIFQRNKPNAIQEYLGENQINNKIRRFIKDSGISKRV